VPRHSSTLPAVALGVAWLAFIAPAAAQSAAQRVDRYFSGLQTLRATFHQEVTDSTGTVREVADGTLAIQKPGRFRWAYDSPSPQLLVSDGRTIWLYDEELEQVTVRKAGEALGATPASLLAGRDKASDAFEAVQGAARDGLEWVDLAPRRQDTDFRIVRLGFAGDQLRRMELEDRLGQTTRIEFSDVVSNPTLPPGLFDFQPPPGVDVVGSAGGP